MECESKISFDTKCTKRSELIGKAFSAFKGMSPNKWKDLDIRKENFANAMLDADLPLSPDEICGQLAALDTGVTEVKVSGSKVSIGIFPLEFPEDFCRNIFPTLDGAGFSSIACNSDSEYGTQVISLKNGKIRKKEDMFDM